MSWPAALRLWMMMLVATLVVGCVAQRKTAAYDYDYDDAGYDGASYDEMDAEVVMVESAVRSERRSRSKSAPGAPPPPPPMATAAAAGTQAAAPDAPAVEAPVQQSRMVFYNGSSTLRVAKVDEAQRQLTAIAASAGGLVENQYGNAITLRVPVARFQQAFDQVLLVGDVLDKRVVASDITDQFTATGLRLKTAQTSRERLIALLALAEDEKEKLFLIREIQRLTEEIDRLEGRSRALESMASFSRITVQLVPRAQVSWRGSGDDAAELRWIRMLSPFRMDVALDNRKLPLAVPAGLVDLRQKGQWVVESADGARVWSANLPNDPLGGVDFWMGALQTRLASEFQTAETGTLGTFSTLRLVSRDDDPYVWVIAVRVVGGRLHLVEQFFPSLEQEARYQEAIRAALAGGGEA